MERREEKEENKNNNKKDRVAGERESCPSGWARYLDSRTCYRYK